MYNLGIEKDYKTIKRVRQKLILDDKVVDFLFNKLKKHDYVFIVNSNKYQEITKDFLRDFLKKVDKDDRYLSLECFAIRDDDPEYEGVPFEVKHASPYDHRWPGDYDPDAYDDWEIEAVSFEDLLYDDTWDEKPIYAKHPEQFNFSEEEITTDPEELVDTKYFIK